MSIVLCCGTFHVNKGRSRLYTAVGGATMKAECRICGRSQHLMIGHPLECEVLHVALEQDRCDDGSPAGTRGGPRRLCRPRPRSRAEFPERAVVHLPLCRRRRLRWQMRRERPALPAGCLRDRVILMLALASLAAILRRVATIRERSNGRSLAYAGFWRILTVVWLGGVFPLAPLLLRA